MSKISPDKIKQWKLIYGDVFEVTVNEMTGYFRNINKADIKSGRLKRTYGKTSYDTSRNTLKLTLLGGDADILNDVSFVVAAFVELEPIYVKQLSKYN